MTCKCECQGLVKIPIERYNELVEYEKIYKTGGHSKGVLLAIKNWEDTYRRLNNG